MAIYTYHCPACNVTFERIIKDYQLIQLCPECYMPAKRTVALPAPAQWVCTKGSL